MQHKSVGVVSLDERVAVLLMQCPLLVRAGICNLFMVPAIARRPFTKDTVGCLTYINLCWQTGCQFNINQRDGTHTHTLMNHPACETPRGEVFIAG